jgi:citrate lyase subunit beta / citryl-CoA lyase
MDVAVARTFLFVPGDRPERFAKALAAGADAVVLDLEDAVAPAAKPGAREHVARWLAQGHQAVVRINAAGTPWHAGDVAMICTRSGAVPALMVPKAEDPGELTALSRALPAGPGIIPLIESAAGVLRAAAVCAVPGVIRPAFGSVDLAAQLGVSHDDPDALWQARSALVLAAASGCAAPVDGVTTSIADDQRLRADLERAVRLGFTGKLCIHPSQVGVANGYLSPSASAVTWARQIIAAAGDGSVTVLDGQMVDRPVVLRAQAILARASHSAASQQAQLL